MFRREKLELDGMIVFHVNLTTRERQCIRDIRIENENIRSQEVLQEFNYFGPISDILRENVGNYFAQLGDNSTEVIDSVSLLVARLAQGMVKIFQQDSSWVCVRTSLPSDEYDIPRWHRDHRYFTSSGKIYKLVFTIKGSPTCFAEKTDAKKYREIGEGYRRNYASNFQQNPKEFKEEDMRIRREIMTVVKEIGPYGKDQAVVYLVGDKDAVVHSVPKMEQPRIFMSVVVGSCDQINEWRERLLNKKFL